MNSSSCCSIESRSSIVAEKLSPYSAPIRKAYSSGEGWSGLPTSQRTEQVYRRGPCLPYRPSLAFRRSVALFSLSSSALLSSSSRSESQPSPPSSSSSRSSTGNCTDTRVTVDPAGSHPSFVSDGSTSARSSPVLGSRGSIPTRPRWYVYTSARPSSVVRLTVIRLRSSRRPSAADLRRLRMDSMSCCCSSVGSLKRSSSGVSSGPLVPPSFFSAFFLSGGSDTV
mmetsp:Transcript_33274/g.74712  ORF Transcript_33274/g.74712 Transcript_33274/m.74712 type:complete len:225 (-) Transcript_33274:413-1087(-)